VATSNIRSLRELQLNPERNGHGAGFWSPVQVERRVENRGNWTGVAADNYLTGVLPQHGMPRRRSKTTALMTGNKRVLAAAPRLRCMPRGSQDGVAGTAVVSESAYATGTNFKRRR